MVSARIRNQLQEFCFGEGRTCASLPQLAFLKRSKFHLGHWRSVSLEPDGRIEQDWIPLPPLNATTPEKNPILSWGMLEIQYAFTCRSF